MKLKHFNLPFAEQLFKAFSDESRIRILFLIYKNGQMCSADLEQVLDFTQAKTSRHLIYLKNSGLVSFRKVDQWVFYYPKDEVSDVIGQLFGYLNRDTVLLNDLETYRILFSNRELAAYKLQRLRK